MFATPFDFLLAEPRHKCNRASKRFPQFAAANLPGCVIAYQNRFGALAQGEIDQRGVLLGDGNQIRDQPQNLFLACGRSVGPLQDLAHPCSYTLPRPFPGFQHLGLGGQGTPLLLPATPILQQLFKVASSQITALPNFLACLLGGLPHFLELAFGLFEFLTLQGNLFKRLGCLGLAIQ
ncbi:hypothetical protein HRbin36_02369 [bacterium HR36]|nr:hypothetical protein HRbin36_02369 [bacterium HR36]